MKITVSFEQDIEVMRAVAVRQSDLSDLEVAQGAADYLVNVVLPDVFAVQVEEGSVISLVSVEL